MGLLEALLSGDPQSAPRNDRRTRYPRIDAGFGAPFSGPYPRIDAGFGFPFSGPGPMINAGFGRPFSGPGTRIDDGFSVLFGPTLRELMLRYQLDN
jgi:hypothetical protein